MPNGDMWRVSPMENMFENRTLARDKSRDLCLSGKAKVGAIAEPPFAPASGSYKLVEFVEVVKGVRTLLRSPASCSRPVRYLVHGRLVARSAIWKPAKPRPIAGLTVCRMAVRLPDDRRSRTRQSTR